MSRSVCIKLEKLVANYSNGTLPCTASFSAYVVDLFLNVQYFKIFLRCVMVGLVQTIDYLAIPNPFCLNPLEKLLYHSQSLQQSFALQIAVISSQAISSLLFEANLQIQFEK